MHIPTEFRADKKQKIDIFRHFEFLDFVQIHKSILLMNLHEIWQTYGTEDALSNDDKIISIRRCFQGQTQNQVKVNK